MSYMYAYTAPPAPSSFVDKYWAYTSDDESWLFYPNEELISAPPTHATHHPKRPRDIEPEDHQLPKRRAPWADESSAPTFPLNDQPDCLAIDPRLLDNVDTASRPDGISQEGWFMRSDQAIRARRSLR